MRANAVGELVGASASVDLSVAQEFADAIGDRLQHISSADAHVSVTGPSEPICQGLAGLAQDLLDSFVKGPFPIDLPVGPADSRYTYSDDSSGQSFTLTVTKVAG